VQALGFACGDPVRARLHCAVVAWERAPIMRSRALLSLLVVVVALAAGCGGSTNKANGARDVGPLTLTLANLQPTDVGVGEWVQAVRRLSHGAIRVEVRGGWRHGQLAAERGTLADVRSGRVDLGAWPALAWDTLGVGSFRALAAPFLVDGFALEQAVLGGPLGRAMLDGLRAAHVAPVAALAGELERPVGISRDLTAPADYRGAAIASRPSALARETWAALGAHTVGLSSGGGLERVDGGESSLAGIDFDGINRYAHSVTADVVLWPRALTVVMNSAAWRRLTEGQRAVLRAAGATASAAILRRLRDQERGAEQGLCGQRFVFVRAGIGGRVALRRAVGPVYGSLRRDAATRRALEAVGALKAALPSQPTPACVSDAGAPVTRALGPLVGVWRSHVTREAMAGARREAGEDVEDNWGDMTLALGAGGRFEFANNRFPGQATSGTWSVRDDVLTMVPRGTVAQGAGEVWRYHWTLFRGTLALRKLAIGPTALTVAPLQRR
jgi:TRAP-type C4-dicarboxylate transport system substrate-binding protein